MEVRDEKRAFFAEMAEAVGISTTDVMSALYDGLDGYHVLFTRGIEEVPEAEVGDQMIFHQTLKRGPDGIFAKFGEEREVGTADEFFSRLQEWS